MKLQIAMEGEVYGRSDPPRQMDVHVGDDKHIRGFLNDRHDAVERMLCLPVNGPPG